MRRLLLFICILFLLVDLADDGALGNAPRFSIPPSSLADSVASSQNCNPDQQDSWCELPPEDLGGTTSPFQSQQLTFSILRKLKVITSCRSSSSGGIPLEYISIPISFLSIQDFFLIYLHRSCP